ncbi:MAG: YihY/virulence factor BrkB family protein [Pseudomonadota bacterium]
MTQTETRPEKTVLLFWWQALVGVYHAIDQKNLALISAGIAFYGILAVFPGLAAIIAIWGLVSDPAIVDAQLDLMRGIIPDDAFRLLSVQVDRLVRTSSSTLGWAGALSILFALWSARSGVSALIRGLNTIHGTRNRGGVMHYLIALFLTACLVGVALVALTTIVIVPIILAFLPLGNFAELVIEVIRWSTAITVLLMALSLLYRYGPNRPDYRMSWITPGSFLVVIFWAAASAGFSLYLSNFGTYNEVYGSIGAVIAMLMWLYISAFLILLGASLNVELARARNAA